MIPGEHTKACLDAEASRKRAQERYDQRWPAQCPFCRTDTDSRYPCPNCLYQLICPRCGAGGAMHPEDATIPCKYCGFDENNSKHKRPPDYECQCRVAREAQRQEELRKLRGQRDRIQAEIDRLQAGGDPLQEGQYGAGGPGTHGYFSMGG